MNNTRYRVEVSNSNGTVTSNTVVLYVSNDTGLTATIWTSQSKYSAGDSIEFGATIVDPTNDPTRLVSWTVELNHQSHTHPVTTLSNVDGGNVTIPFEGELDPNQGYTFSVFIYNSITLFSTKVRISPNLGVVSLETDPPGLGLLIDEADTYPIYALNVSGVINMKRTFYAPGAQSISNETYLFVGWSDGDTNNEKSIIFVLNSVITLKANYCSVIDCPDLPFAPITERQFIPPPVANQPLTNGTASIAPGQPIDAPVEAGRQLISSYSPLIESLRSTATIVSLVCGFVLFW